MPPSLDASGFPGFSSSQDLTGLNKARNGRDLWDSDRNRLVATFLAIVDWFNPAFVLIENVLDSVTRKQGAYMRFALSRLVSMGYQARMGIVEAGGQGPPQGRYRALVWGARMGEQLPALPGNSHGVRRRGGGAAQVWPVEPVVPEPVASGSSYLDAMMGCGLAIDCRLTMRWNLAKKRYFAVLCL